jgi:hypothetical protein
VPKLAVNHAPRVSTATRLPERPALFLGVFQGYSDVFVRVLCHCDAFHACASLTIIPLLHITAKSNALPILYLKTRVLLLTRADAGRVDPRFLWLNRNGCEIIAVALRCWFQFCTTGILIHLAIS